MKNSLFSPRRRIIGQWQVRAAVLAIIAAHTAAHGADGPAAARRSNFAVPRVVADAASACASLTGRVVEPASIGEPTTGASVASAAYKVALPGAADHAKSVFNPATPEYCEVLVDIRPVDPAAPSIRSQINLPTRWNGKKLQFGGGGFNGVLERGLGPSRGAGPEVALPIMQGFMTAGTDSGHQTPPGANRFEFALNDEAFANFAYASYKKTHDVAVELAKAYYAHMPQWSYYMGASEGGREAMTMAQRYPADFDGIYAVDPVMNWTALQTFGNHVGGRLQAVPGGWLDGKTRLVHDTVVGACDALDGIKDGVVSHYKACRPRAAAALAARLCPSGGEDGADCLSKAQLQTVQAAHDGYKFTFALANGITAYAGLGYGGEALEGNWSTWMNGTAPPTVGPDSKDIPRLYANGNGAVRYFFTLDRNFDPLSYDPAKHQARVLEVSKRMDATDPDLSVFYRRGGKLILREDLADTAQSPYSGLDYWDSVVVKMGKGAVDEFFAAYVAPGLPHTSTGIAAGAPHAPAYGIAGAADLLARLEEWVERGIRPGDVLELANRQPLPPHALLASRPLCRYHSYPKFVGSSPSEGNVASSYICAKD